MYPTARTKLVVSSMVEMRTMPAAMQPVLARPCRRYCPQDRESRLPATMEPMTIPSIMGVKKPPLPVAEAPRTAWKNSGRKMTLPNNPEPGQERDDRRDGNHPVSIYFPGA